MRIKCDLLFLLCIGVLAGVLITGYYGPGGQSRQAEAKPPVLQSFSAQPSGFAVEK